MQISFNHVVELNKLLSENNLDYRVHIKDACGSSYLWIESLNPDIPITSNNQVFTFIDDYFDKRHIRLAYDEEKLTFWAAR